ANISAVTSAAAMADLLTNRRAGQVIGLARDGHVLELEAVRHHDGDPGVRVKRIARVAVEDAVCPAVHSLSNSVLKVEHHRLALDRHVGTLHLDPWDVLQ